MTNQSRLWLLRRCAINRTRGACHPGVTTRQRERASGTLPLADIPSEKETSMRTDTDNPAETPPPSLTRAVVGGLSKRDRTDTDDLNRILVAAIHDQATKAMTPQAGITVSKLGSTVVSNTALAQKYGKPCPLTGRKRLTHIDGPLVPGAKIPPADGLDEVALKKRKLELLDELQALEVTD